MKSAKHELVNNDTVFIGSALGIVEQMREQAYFERGLPVDSYIDTLVHTVAQLTGIEINLSDGEVEERAEALIQQLVKHGFFKEA